MIPFPEIDPVIFSLGPLKVRWYGLMYVIGFSASYFLVKYQIQKFGYKKLAEHFDNINITLIISLIIGGRLGYVLFYNLPYYIEHPLEIPATWSGGMSFHGATLALIIGGALFAWIKKIDFWKGADIYTVTIPVGLGFGRIGNFINGELFGRTTEVPWGMVFPGGGSAPRHPSQLYEALLEGLVLFLILWSLKHKPWESDSSWPHGSMLALFLIGYGMMRFMVEFFREPDPQIGLISGVLTMGQILCLAMVAGGAAIMLYRKRQIR
ncbi:MAG: prolipoprotein diacylglyceryl transferase [Desulfobulbaceae bacterium]|nr:MAG: prolipoprotein diacylglyceryl transferase [Desulfobulbaceae bacterium]